jgi:hypothetical protein
MDKTTYKKGVSGTNTVSNLISAVLTDSGTGLVAVIPTAISTVTIGSMIPLVSHREAIRMIVQASHCNAFINRSNELELFELTVTTAEDTLNDSNMYDYPKITNAEPVNKVEVSSYALIDDTFPASLSLLYGGTVYVNGTENMWITYSKPGRNVAIYSSSGTVNTALSTYYLYGADLNITGTGDVTLMVSGYGLEESESIYKLDNVGAGETEQLLKIQNRLVTTTSLASAVATWAYAVANKKVTYTIQERGNPAREIGDTATVYDAFSANNSVLITKEQYNFDGTLSADTKGWN